MASDVDCGIAAIAHELKTASSSDNDDDDNECGFFECNICLELAQDPIVTLCGHLYCWPCLYRWLQVHSYSHECPVCKALVEEDKLVPIYGRGKENCDPRSRVLPEVIIPNRPVGQRPRTARPLDASYLRRNELGHHPMASGRFDNLTLSALLGIIPAIFSLQANGINGANAYGVTTGVPPYMFPTSFHGGHAHGFYHHPSSVEEKHRLMKMLFLMLGVLVILCLIFR